MVDLRVRVGHVDEADWDLYMPKLFEGVALMPANWAKMDEEVEELAATEPA